MTRRRAREREEKVKREEKRRWGMRKDKIERRIENWNWKLLVCSVLVDCSELQKIIVLHSPFRPIELLLPFVDCAKFTAGFFHSIHIEVLKFFFFSLMFHYFCWYFVYIRKREKWRLSRKYATCILKFHMVLNFCEKS